jgi:RNA polymerase sigma-70 factor, ECF subfamily
VPTGWPGGTFRNSPSSGLPERRRRDCPGCPSIPAQVPGRQHSPRRLSLTDAELVERALAGAEDGFRQLVARHERAVYNLVVRVVRDPALAEDVSQDSFLKAFSHLDRFDPAYKFQSWILRIARNTAIDALRRRAPRQEVSLEAASGPDGPRLEEILADPDSDRAWRSLERGDLSRAMADALSRLRPEYREVLVLRYHEDLSYEEIAGIVGLPLGTVKSNLHRARAEMAEHLRRAGWPR